MKTASPFMRRLVVFLLFVVAGLALQIGTDMVNARRERNADETRFTIS